MEISIFDKILKHLQTYLHEKLLAAIKTTCSYYQKSNRLFVCHSI